MIQFAAILERDLHISGFWRFGTGSELLDLPELRLAVLSRWHPENPKYPLPQTWSEQIILLLILLILLMLLIIINYNSPC